MKTKHVIGQTIKYVVQSRAKTNAGRVVTVDRIVLSNGVSLFPSAYETDYGPVGDISASRPRKARRPS